MAYYKRRIYLINPKFQIKFSLFLCFLIALVSVIYPYTLYQIIESVINNYAGDATILKQKRNALLIILGAWQLGFSALVFIISIFFSHKIAGPLYKLKNYLIQIKEGQTVDKLFFRKGDYFQEIAEEFNHAMDKIQSNSKKDFEYLNEISAYLNNISLVVPDDKKAILNEINKKISEMQERFNNL